MKKICCFFFCLLLCLVPVSATSRTLVVSGDTVMIHAEYEGVLISGAFEFTVEDQLVSSHPSDSVQQGDLIVGYKGTPIHSCADLNHIIASTSITDKSLDVTIERNDIKQQAKLYLYFDSSDQTFKTGFYIKDHISGVGTLTYYDAEHKTYGALGHEIAEKSTGKKADIHKGEILLGKVTSIVPSVINQPGEKVSRSTGLSLGNIIINNEFGLFGMMQQPITGKEMEIALQHQIHLGKAVLLTVLKDTEIVEIPIEITKIHRQSSPEIKGIEFTILDDSKAQTTGGIVQGMSGSPILQDGRIAGAVTHMIPSSPYKGYGIFIEWMLMNSDQIHS